MKPYIVITGAAVVALVAGGASATSHKSHHKSHSMSAGMYEAPSQPIPYAQLDSYLAAKPSQRASMVDSGAAMQSSAPPASSDSSTAPPTTNDMSGSSGAPGASGDTAPTQPPASPPTPRRRLRTDRARHLNSWGGRHVPPSAGDRGRGRRCC